MEVTETTLGNFAQSANENVSNAEVSNEIKAEEKETPPAPTLNENLNATEEQVKEAATEETPATFKIDLGDEAETPANAAAPKIENTQVNWQDVIKNIDPKEIAKAIGFKDFAIEMNEHLTKGGQAIDYLNAKAIDYTKVSDVDMIKDNFLKQNPSVTKAQLELWVQRKYNQSESAEEEDREFGLMELQLDANKLRQQKIAEQQSFKIAETPQAVQPNMEAQKAFEDAQKAEQEKIDRHYQYILNDEATKSLMESKRVSFTLGEGVTPFNVPIDRPDLLMKVINDGAVWSKVLHNEKGEPKVALMQKLALHALDPDYEKRFYDAGLMAAKQKLVTENQNIKKPEGGALINMGNQGVKYMGETTFGAANNR